MLYQNIVQVYRNENDDAVVVIGKFDGFGNDVTPEAVVIPFCDIKNVAKALNKIANEIIKERI